MLTDDKSIHQSGHDMRTIFYTITLVAGLIFLSACGTTDKAPTKQEKNQWLAKQYSDKPKIDEQPPLLKLPQSSTRFRQHILAGKLDKGMTLDEALASIRSEPFGTLPKMTKFWCDEKTVSQCHSQCAKCQAMLFGQSSIVFLDGFGSKPLLTDYYPNRFADFKATVSQADFRFADHIYKNKITRGMSAGVVQLIINREGHRVNYFCNHQATGSTASCLGTCDICKLEITPRFDSRQKQLIRLETHAGQQSVSEILTTQ